MLAIVWALIAAIGVLLFNYWAFSRMEERESFSGMKPSEIDQNFRQGIKMISLLLALMLVGLLLYFAGSEQEVTTESSTFTYTNFTIFTNKTVCTGGIVVDGSCVGVGSSASNENDFETRPFLTSSSVTRTTQGSTDAVFLGVNSGNIWVVFLGILLLSFILVVVFNLLEATFGKKGGGSGAQLGSHSRT